MSKTKYTEVSTSKGVFLVGYSGYYKGWRGSYWEPPEYPSVEIDSIEYVDDESEYDSTIEELENNDSFIEEVQQSVLDYIQDCDISEKIEAAIARYEYDRERERDSKFGI